VISTIASEDKRLRTNGGAKKKDFSMLFLALQPTTAG